MANADSRCWPGYEPVPGKKPHERGSCRPKAASKLTAGERRFRTARKRQLDAWSKEHPGARRSAAQHLAAPGEGPKKRRTAAPKRAAAKTATGKTAARKTARKAAPRKTAARKTTTPKRPASKRPAPKRPAARGAKAKAPAARRSRARA